MDGRGLLNILLFYGIRGIVNITSFSITTILLLGGEMGPHYDILLQQFRDSIAPALGLPRAEWPEDLSSEENIKLFLKRLCVIGAKLKVDIFDLDVDFACEACRSAINLERKTGKPQDVGHTTKEFVTYNAWLLFLNSIKKERPIPKLCEQCWTTLRLETTKVERQVGGYTIKDVPEYISWHVKRNIRLKKYSRNRERSGDKANSNVK